MGAYTKNLRINHSEERHGKPVEAVAQQAEYEKMPFAFVHFCYLPHRRRFDFAFLKGK